MNRYSHRMSASIISETIECDQLTVTVMIHVIQLSQKTGTVYRGLDYLHSLT